MTTDVSFIEDITTTPFDGVARLRDFLELNGPGRVADADGLAGLLAPCWDELDGSDEGGMRASKLRRRMEAPRWTPPVLSFRIERHGAAAYGSTRAELQCWSVDLERMTADIEATKRRQIRPQSAPHRTAEMRAEAEELAQIIAAGEEDERIRWRADGSVHINVACLIGPSCQRTEAGRRRRFRGALVPAMAAEGWEHVGRNVYSSAG